MSNTLWTYDYISELGKRVADTDRLKMSFTARATSDIVRNARPQIFYIFTVVLECVRYRKYL